MLVTLLVREPCLPYLVVRPGSLSSVHCCEQRGILNPGWNLPADHDSDVPEQPSAAQTLHGIAGMSDRAKQRKNLPKKEITGHMTR